MLKQSNRISHPLYISYIAGQPGVCVREIVIVAVTRRYDMSEQEVVRPSCG